MIHDFRHIQSAHCENGVITNLLKIQGAEFMNEPLAFGIGSGLFYIHIPFLTINNGPAVSFRTMPGKIFKRTCKSLDINIDSKRFGNEASAQQFLDQKIKEGVAVGCQVGVFNLLYFPVEYRFHFNAHNLIVYGKHNGRYQISDPVMDAVTELTEEELNRVRFAKGMFAPKGHLYYIKAYKPISDDTIRKSIATGIKRNCRDMLHIPGCIAGVQGIEYTSKKIRKWRDELGVRKAGQYLGQIIRMQEEIGTGGGGFRYIYAAFLQEAAKYYGNDQFLKYSDEFTAAGDLWRTSAVKMAGALKGRASEQSDYNDIADLLVEISAKERAAFKGLSQIRY